MRDLQNVVFLTKDVNKVLTRKEKLLEQQLHTILLKRSTAILGKKSAWLLHVITVSRAAEREGQRGQFAPGPLGPGGLIDLYQHIIYSLFRCIQRNSQ